MRRAHHAQVLDFFTQRLRTRHLQEAFVSWQLSAHRDRTLRCAVAHFMHSALVGAWAAWLDHHAVCRMARAAMHGDRGTLRHCLATWAAAAVEARVHKEQVARAALKFFATTLQKAWTTWRVCNLLESACLAACLSSGNPLARFVNWLQCRVTFECF